MNGPRALNAALLAALLPLTAGCAAAAIPVVAGAVVAKKTADGPDRKVDPQVAAPPASRVTVFGDGSTPRSGVAGSMGAPQAMPPASPPAPTGGGSYQAFTSFALAQAAAPHSATPRQSALVDPATLLAGTKMLTCGDAPLAVVVDLDPGKAAFDLADAPLPATGLARQLAALRQAGLTVLWSASLPVKDAERLWTLLRATGLDPERTDRLLLLRKGNERKQERRLAAAKDWCIVAIAGDRPADFEEALEYLRDPDGPIAQALKPNFDAGWFIAPPPIQ